MTDTLALENLFNQVTKQFAADGTLVPNLFGWREKNKHVTNSALPVSPGNRVIWTPGDEEGSGDLGKIAPPSKMSQDNQNPRSLGTLLETFTVYIQASDASAPTNEMAQYKAARLLYDAWWRAAYLVAYGTIAIISHKWDRSKTERQHGAMLVVLCTIQAMIPDTAYAIAPADAHAELTTTVLDETDPTVEVDPA